MTEKQYRQRLANIERIAAKRRAQTHCKRGHEFTEGNTYRRSSDGRRQCWICKGERDQEYYWAMVRRQIATRINTFGV